MRKENFAEKIIKGTGEEALEEALSYYRKLEEKTRNFLRDIDSISREEILKNLDELPYDIATRVLIYRALIGTKELEKVIFERIGYLDFKDPDLRALETIGIFPSSGKSSKAENYLRFLRKSYKPLKLPLCCLYSTATSVILKENPDIELFRKALERLHRCDNDFEKSAQVLLLIESARGKIATVTDEIIEFQRSILYDSERGKILSSLAFALAKERLLTEELGESLIYAAREIETTPFRYRAIMDITKAMKEAGFREKALSFVERIENTFWQGGIAYELLKEEGETLLKKGLQFVRDPYWKLLLKLSSASGPVDERKIIQDFIEDPFLPLNLKTRSLGIIKNRVSPENRDMIENFLKNRAEEEEVYENTETPYNNEFSLEENIKLFLSLPVPERDFMSKKLANEVMKVPSREKFKSFFMEILHHPQAVETLLCHKVREGSPEEAMKIITLCKHW